MTHSNNNQVIEYQYHFVVMVTQQINTVTGEVVSTLEPVIEDTLPPDDEHRIYRDPFDVSKRAGWVTESPADRADGVWVGNGWHAAQTKLNNLLKPQKVCVACGKQCGTDPKHKDMYNDSYHSDCWHESFYEQIKTEPVGTTLCCGQCTFAVMNLPSGPMAGKGEPPTLCIVCSEPIDGQMHGVGGDPCCADCWHEGADEVGKDCDQCGYKTQVAYCASCGERIADDDGVFVFGKEYCRGCTPRG